MKLIEKQAVQMKNLENSCSLFAKARSSYYDEIKDYIRMHL